MKRNLEKNFTVPNFIDKQSNNACWNLKDLEETICFGENLIKKHPYIKLLLLKGSLGAGKTSLIKGIGKGIGINEPITSPTFPLSQHYPNGTPPLIHLDLYRLENPKIANDFFLQEEEEAQEMKALMAVEWSERLTLLLPEAWIAKLEYSNNNERIIQIIPPQESARNSFTC